jgi:hypothetical protein
VRFARTGSLTNTLDWRIQWARAEWTPPYKTTFTLAWDADGAIDPAKSRFDNHRMLDREPWPTYFKPPQAAVVPVNDPGGGPR